MKKNWKLWPKDYKYRKTTLILGIGMVIAMILLAFQSAKGYSIMYEKEVEDYIWSSFLLTGPILLVSLFWVIHGTVKNVRVRKLRKELELLKANYTCYEGMVSGLEQYQVNDVMKRQASNRYNKYTYSVYRILVDYIDEDGRKRIATSEEYSDNPAAFLKDNKAKVYVSKNGNNRIIDDLSWRQSYRDAFIELPDVQMSNTTKKLYYLAYRWWIRIELILLFILFIKMVILLFFR